MKRRFRDCNALEKPILAGQMLHLVLRKRFLDDEVRAAIEAGATQVLVIGGGFDTLSLRLAKEFPAVSFLEVDHPPTHEVKARAVTEMGDERPNLRLEGVDLAQRSLAEFLQQSPDWSIEAMSAVVAEGVLMYLTEADVVAFLEAVRDCTRQGSRLLFTYVYEGALSRKNLGWLGGALTLFLKLSGEPFRWGVSPAGLEPFLEVHGYRTLAGAERFDLERRYLRAAGLADRKVARFERVAAAELAEISSG